MFAFENITWNNYLHKRVTLSGPPTELQDGDSVLHRIVWNVLSAPRWVLSCRDSATHVEIDFSHNFQSNVTFKNRNKKKRRKEIRVGKVERING